MRTTKTKILILLLLFPMILSLGASITNVEGRSTIPAPDPRNSWHWGVNVGDMIMFESEMILTNFSSQEVKKMNRNMDIWNITSIINETGGIYGFYPFQNFSKVIGDLMYEDTVGTLSAVLSDAPLALFGYNDTFSKEFYLSGGGVVPYIFPINDTVLDIGFMASLFNETCLYPLTEMGLYNKFDNYTYDEGKTEILFQNTTDGYYFRASFYPNNGTLKDMDGYYLVNMGELMALNVSGKRVFDHDVTDEVVWGVSPGETFYYYVNQTGYDTFLARLKVQGFNKSVYWSTNWTIYPMDWPMVFEEVLVEMSMWNGTGWSTGGTMPLTAANNFYPMCIPLMQSLGGQSGFILPTSATVEDFLFMFNNHTADITQWFPFDTVHYEVSGNIVNFTMSQSGNGQVSVGVFNLDTGLVELQYATYLGEIQMWFELADELVEWDVDIGDNLYFKQIIDGNMEERRFIIDSIEYKFLDVTTIGFPIPTGQPKYQFFTEVYANFSVWMKDTETWFDPGGTWEFSAANEYWPIAPYHMMGNMPYLLPEGTVANDLQNLFNILSMWYDDITYNPGHVIMRNTTASKEFHFYFDETTGRMTYLGGENYAMNEWWPMAVYPEFIQNLNTGANTFVLSDNFDMDPTLTVDIDITGSTEPDFIYAVLPHNPIGIPLPNGTALLYLDHKITDHSAVVGNVTMTLQFPSSIQISENFIYLYAFNVSGTGEWDLAPPEYYLYGVTYDLANNRMTFQIQIAGPYMYISAVSYEELPPDGDGTPPIPGYDLLILSLAIITVSALLIKKMYKKK
ncbi:MAG: hypothetical protein ACFE8B_02245 [Candidatus Hermodarchaeota archaeon]